LLDLHSFENAVPDRTAFFLVEAIVYTLQQTPAQQRQFSQKNVITT